MAVIVPPAANADSYVSVADANAYHIAYSDPEGQAAWEGLTEPRKEQLLRKATVYIDSVYGARFLGAPTDAAQPLAWPRKLVFVGSSTESLDDEIVPVTIARATAWAALASVMFGDLNTSTGAVVKREKIGPIETEYAVSNSGSSGRLPRFPFLDAMIGNLTGRGFGQLRADRG